MKNELRKRWAYFVLQGVAVGGTNKMKSPVAMKSLCYEVA